MAAAAKKLEMRQPWCRVKVILRQRGFVMQDLNIKSSICSLTLNSCSASLQGAARLGSGAAAGSLNREAFSGHHFTKSFRRLLMAILISTTDLE